MDIDSLDQANELSQLHFLTALIDELMKAMLASGAMSREQLQKIEMAAAEKVGSVPRAW